MTVDLWGIKIRFGRNYAVLGDTEVVNIDWTLVIGLATPSLTYFPMAWNLLAFDKRTDCPMTADFIRMPVADS